MTAPDGKKPIVIDGVRLIDGSGNSAIEDAIVVIQGDRITGAGPRVAPPGARDRVEIPADADVIPGLGRTVVPGLIDVHVHVPTDANMALYVKNGVTSIRFAGGQQRFLLSLRDRINRGFTAGPRVFSVGAGVDSTPHAWPGSNAADSPIEARRLVRRLVQVEQVDAILATHRVSRPVLAAIVETAHELGIPVTGQTWTSDARDAIAVGMDGLENTARIPESDDFPLSRLFSYTSVSNRLAILSHLWVKADWSRTTEIAHQFAESGLALAPELVSFEGWARLSEEELKADRDWPRAAGDPEVAQYQGHVNYITKDWSKEDYAAQAEAIERYREFCRIYYRAGGLLVAGTDMGFGGILLHRELWHFQKFGLSNLEAIRTATRQAASALGRDDLGLIAPGLLADLVVVSGNPAEDLRALRNVDYVFVNGRPIVTRGQLAEPVTA